MTVLPKRHGILLLALLQLHCAAAVTIGGTSVFGHKIPDTDAICAAIAYSWELNTRGIEARPFRLGSLNRETEYVLQAFDMEAPELLGALEPGAPVAVVDTNNPKELPDDLEVAELHSIVDHHKLCGLTTGSVLEIDIRPLCSTGSILYARAKALGLKPPPKIAGLMLSCILSDSLEFRSPTTTSLDRELAEEVRAVARPEPSRSDWASGHAGPTHAACAGAVAAGGDCGRGHARARGGDAEREGADRPPVA
jgi:inorganic pyrophosphatase/exopolyphosphatase